MAEAAFSALDITDAGKKHMVACKRRTVGRQHAQNLAARCSGGGLVLIEPRFPNHPESAGQAAILHPGRRIAQVLRGMEAKGGRLCFLSIGRLDKSVAAWTILLHYETSPRSTGDSA